MIKKAFIIALTICLSLILFSPVSVQAQSGLRITGTSASVEFPDRLNFNLSAWSDARITDVRLHYIVDQASFARVTSEVFIEFVPDTTVGVNWTWDMKQTGGLPPGATVEYWWTVTDSRGNKVVTDRIKVIFDDNRHTWQDLTEGKISIYWYESSLSVVQDIMSAAQGALTRLLKDTGAELKKPVKIYLYPSAADLQGAMIFPQEWTGGVSFTGFGIIAIGLQQFDSDWNKRAIAHELTHLVIEQVTANPYNELPTWLNEGLAMYNEGPLQASFASQLINAVAGNRLISVRSLCSPFSAYADKATLAYAQSQSLVEFLIKNYGQAKMFNLLNTFQEGSSYDGALMKVYGFDMDGLNTLWRDYVIKKYQPAAANAVMKLPSMVVSLVRQASRLLANMPPDSPSFTLRLGQ